MVSNLCSLITIFKEGLTPPSRFFLFFPRSFPFSFSWDKFVPMLLSFCIAKGVPVDDVPVIGWCSRSLWKPEHSYEGLLYRVGEHVIYTDPDKGDIAVLLESLFSVRINIVSSLFCKGRHFKYDGEAEIGLRQVCPTDDTIIFKSQCL